MIRWICLSSILLLVSGPPATAQKLDSRSALVNSEMTHKDDLVVGPLKMTLHSIVEGKAVNREVTVLFITRDRVIYREADGERAKYKASNDSTFVKLVHEVPKQPKDLEWVRQNGKIAGPLVPPETIDVSPARLTKEQQIGFLVERAEVLYTELHTAMSARNQQGVTDLVAYADLLKAHATKERLGASVVELFELKSYMGSHEQLIKQRTEQFDAVKKLQLDEAKMRGIAQGMFKLRRAEAYVEAIARGADSIDGDDPTEVGHVGAALGKFGQAAAQRRIDQQRMDAIAKVSEPVSKRVADANVSLKQNQTRVADRVKAMWTSMDLDETVMKSLDRLATDLLDGPTPDVSAALEVLDARIKYTKTRNIPSPNVIALRNNLKAVSLLKRVPRDKADRTDRAQQIYELGRDTIAATKSVPDGAIFDPDRIQLLIGGAKLIQLAVSYACEPLSSISNPAQWDVRADYGARVLKTALSFGNASDLGGHARITRGVLLLQRGLPADALAQVETDARLWEKQPNYMLQLTRIACQNNATKQAGEYFQTALKGGYRAGRDLATDKDFQALWTSKPQPLFVADRDKPKVTVYLTMNSLTAKNNFQTYDVKIVNQGSYPIVDATVRCDIVFVQAGKKTPHQSKPFKIDYIGPAGSGREEYFWPDAFEVSGQITQSNLAMELAPKTPKAKPPSGSFTILKGNNTFYGHYWWWYYY